MIDKMSHGGTDSGWAWVVVIAVTIINLAILPIQQCFGLIFAERFESLGITATETSFILHLNGTIACSLGLISGPMLKRFAFRKVAFFGGFIVTMGICMTAFAASVPSIIITYCVIVGVGHGIMFPATNLAMNTYFRKKRNIAMGLSVTLTGLGPTVMPLLIAIFLETYATTGTLIVLAGIAAHSFIGASLLKPLKEKQIRSIRNGNDGAAPSAECNSNDATQVDENLKINANNDVKNGEAHQRLLNEEEKAETKGCEQIGVEDGNTKNGKKKTFLSQVSENLDLALLKDNRYIAVILGMGVSLVAETNFNAMFPFVLGELSGLNRNTIATVMSIQAASDITGRLCVPLLAQKSGWTSRNLYVLSLLGSTLGRTILSTWSNNYIIVIGVALIIGVAKGTKAVFQALIIPDYVPLERLPAAYGMQMVCSGLLSIALGPIIGVVHDSMKSYVGALHFTSMLSLSCVFLWYIGGLWRFKKDSAAPVTKREGLEMKDSLES